MKPAEPPSEAIEDSAEEAWHVDHFIYRGYQEDCYARWVLMHCRLPAALKIDFMPFMRKFPLFCTYGSIRFRVTGASAMGDVWLSHSFEERDGYDLRVPWQDCTSWSDKPWSKP